jgi:hypothetical protein
VGASTLMEELIHVTTNKLALNIVKDWVSANVLMKEPIHVVINESGFLTLEKQVQHIVVFVPPSDQVNYNYANSSSFSMWEGGWVFLAHI